MNETEPSKLCIRSMAMIYDNGIFVNDQIGISATFSLVALGVSILGMVLQILAGILLFRGAAHIAKQECCAFAGNPSGCSRDENSCYRI